MQTVFQADILSSVEPNENMFLSLNNLSLSNYQSSGETSVFYPGGLSTFNAGRFYLHS